MQRNQTKNKNALRFLPGKHKIDCGFLISINGWEIIMAQVNQLGTDRIGKLVLRLAIPSMLAQFVNVLYSIVDRMYIGNIPVIGDTALAGVGVCGPIVTLISSFAFLVGVGGAPLIAMRLGEKNWEQFLRSFPFD